MSIETIKDEKIKHLAKTLRANGLAASDTEAERMAIEISGTADRVQKSFEEPEPESTNVRDVVSRIQNQETHSSSMEDDFEELNPVSEKDIKEMDAEAIYKGQEDLLKSSGDFGNKSISELMNNQQDIISEPVSEPELVVQAESNSNVDLGDELEISDPNEEVQVFQREYSEDEVEPELVNESDVDVEDGFEDDAKDDAEEEVKSDEVDEDEERKKKRDAMPESTIDLADVFNFTKK